jgi:acetyltransferase-like isoleucine patch superfamily enzyme
VRLADRLRRFERLRWFYRRALMAAKRWRYGLRHVHPTFYMSGASVVARDLVAHEYAFINEGCHIGPAVELGPYVMFGPRVAVVGGDHVFDRPGTPIIFSGRPPLPRTVIDADAWVGHGAIILAGVRIGRGAIIAAGAVVTKDVPPYEIHGGVPARRIGTRFEDPADRERHDTMLDAPPRAGLLAGPLGED